MGYSVYIVCKNKEQVKEIYDNISKKISKSNEYRFAFGNAKKTGLSYNKHKDLAIGFDYTCLDDARNYVFGIIKWIAGFVGTEVYYYDGAISINIITNEENVLGENKIGKLGGIE